MLWCGFIINAICILLRAQNGVVVGLVSRMVASMKIG